MYSVLRRSNFPDLCRLCINLYLTMYRVNPLRVLIVYAFTYQAVYNRKFRTCLLAVGLDECTQWWNEGVKLITHIRISR